MAGKTLTVDIPKPSAMNELQLRFLIDFVFQWRFFFDDHHTWRYPSKAFNVLCIGLLRIAAWDFGVDLAMEGGDDPLQREAFPSWRAPETNIYWFHGFLVLHCKDVNYSLSNISEVAFRVRVFLVEQTRPHLTVQCILISIGQVALVEVKGRSACSTVTLPLITNTASRHATPGMRMLTYLLTSSSWRRDFVNREQWSSPLPVEIMRMITAEVPQSDMIALARSSQFGERWYYSTLPFVLGMPLRVYKETVTCCGATDRLEGEGLLCRKCYAWQHASCVEPNPRKRKRAAFEPESGSHHESEASTEAEHICADCRKAGLQFLEPGRLGLENRRKKRRAIQGQRYSLRLRGQQGLLCYTILFNRVSSGLVYRINPQSHSQGRAGPETCARGSRLRTPLHSDPFRTSREYLAFLESLRD
ncbi:MAG: hypothetical protein M1819_004190 [Sarea resinae]|nr:MAG: hypothetical protein M1819_004190 [Sarea resinae]